MNKENRNSKKSGEPTIPWKSYLLFEYLNQMRFRQKRKNNIRYSVPCLQD
jgi:hypothetical protein